MRATWTLFLYLSKIQKWNCASTSTSKLCLLGWMYSITFQNSKTPKIFQPNLRLSSVLHVFMSWDDKWPNSVQWKLWYVAESSRKTRACLKLFCHPANSIHLSQRNLCPVSSEWSEQVAGKKKVSKKVWKRKKTDFCSSRLRLTD